MAIYIKNHVSNECTNISSDLQYEKKNFISNKVNGKLPVTILMMWSFLRQWVFGSYFLKAAIATNIMIFY